MSNPYIRSAGYVIFRDAVDDWQAFLESLGPEFDKAKRILEVDWRAVVARASNPTVLLGYGLATFATQAEYDELKNLKNAIPPGDPLRDWLDWGQMRSIARPDLSTFWEWAATLSPPLVPLDEPETVLAGNDRSIGLHIDRGWFLPIAVEVAALPDADFALAKGAFNTVFPRLLWHIPTGTRTTIGWFFARVPFEVFEELWAIKPALSSQARMHIKRRQLQSEARPALVSWEEWLIDEDLTGTRP